jgi:hypothetical protein
MLPDFFVTINTISYLCLNFKIVKRSKYWIQIAIVDFIIYFHTIYIYMTIYVNFYDFSSILPSRYKKNECIKN